MSSDTTEDERVGVIGLGYVGLPLAVEFGSILPTVGFDVSETRIEQLQIGVDVTGECSADDIRRANKLSFSSAQASLIDCNRYLITVPTPVDSDKQPDFRPLIAASKVVGKSLCAGDIVIYESTVFPGATEEICVPVLEEASGKKYNVDFFCGYSPERINPGDKKRSLKNVVKVTSGSTPAVAEVVDNLYLKIITAGTLKVSSMKVAEASKVVENVQRDVNIALVNEISRICDHLDIDTQDIIDAAATKWNFQNFRPGLVGGHCIGVDPYYLIARSQQKGFYPHLIASSRRINDEMVEFACLKLIKALSKNHASFPGTIALLGMTFKEDCTDIRNSQSFALAKHLESFGLFVDCYDPCADPVLCAQIYGSAVHNTRLLEKNYEALVFAVGHEQYKNLDHDFWDSMSCRGVKVVFDIKGVLNKQEVISRDIAYITL